MEFTEEQYDAINHENTNIIVSAGAGSGKTAVLSERVLRKVKNNIPVNKLLVLTFTNAAAAEMKERIRKKLIKANLIEQASLIDSAYITTFDSYALSLVKKYHYLFNISRDIKIIDDSLISLEKEKILEDIFERLYSEKNTKFLKLIDDFCVKDDKEIKEDILKINNKLDLLYNKEEYLKSYLSKYDNLDFLVQKYLEFLKTKIQEVEDNLKEMKLLDYNDYTNELEETLMPLINSNNYIDIKNNSNVNLKRLPNKSSEELKELKENINSSIKNLSELTKYENEEEIKKQLLLTQDYADIICQIILEFTDKLNKFKYEKNEFEFIDISKMATKLVDENEDIRNEIKNEYNEILLDEYQDTNDLQEKFVNLIENNNVYMVGDMKQSIYRFRNANPYIFKEKYDNYSKNNNGYKIDLNKNFRSRDEVIKGINLIFDYIMDNQIGDSDYRKEHRLIFGNEDYINKGKTEENNDLEILEYEYDKDSIYNKEEIEIFTIASDIKNKIKNNYQIYDKDLKEKRNIKYSDFVILMDRSTNFDLYKKIFEYLELPLTIKQDEDVSGEDEIFIIKNILNLIVKRNNVDEEFIYSFMSVARSYLFRFSDQDIFKTIKDETFNNSEVITKIDEIIESLNSLSLNQIIHLIIDKFNFYEKMITVGDIENRISSLDYIIDLTNNLETLGYDINNLSAYLNEIIEKDYKIKYANDSSDQDSIKIMTIHKSKGLEYPICYYSGLYKEFNNSDAKEKFGYDEEYGIILPVFDEGIDTTIVHSLFKEKLKKEEISEKIRLFYVALTRAREKMILIMPKNEKEKYLEDDIVPYSIRIKYNSFSDILNSVSNIIETYKKTIDLNSINLTKDYNYTKKKNYKERINYTKEYFDVNEINVEIKEKESKRFSKSDLKLHTKQEYENMKYGKKRHEEFEYDLNKQEEFINKYFKDLKLIRSCNEFEFMYEENNTLYHGIMDLVLEFEDSIKIIDYKLKNIIDPEYKNQLMGYKKYLESINDKKVDIYLYSIINDELEQM